MIAWVLMACAPATVAEFAPPTDLAPGLATTEDHEAFADTGDATAPDEVEPLALCINEFLPDNDAALLLDDGSSPDWIELHNPGEEPVLLAGWSLSDDPDEPAKHALHSDVTVPPFGFVLLYADGSDAVDPERVSFKLAADGGSLGLYDPTGQGEVLHYGAVEPDFSVYRKRDCCAASECLGFDWRGTPGATNGG